MIKMTLLSNTKKYFTKLGYDFFEGEQLYGYSGQLRYFDLLISGKGNKRLVVVFDWKKTVGVDMIIKTDRAASDVNLERPIIVARKFSDHARAYANRRSLSLLTIHEIMSVIK